MASGHLNRANRSNTWLHRPAANVKKTLANEAPSTHGTSATWRGARTRSALSRLADILGIGPESRVRWGGWPPHGIDVPQLGCQRHQRTGAVHEGT